MDKTTSVREIARLLSEECRKRVVIIDTSNEIGGDGDIPHPGIGRARRMQARARPGCQAQTARRPLWLLTQPERRLCSGLPPGVLGAVLCNALLPARLCRTFETNFRAA